MTAPAQQHPDVVEAGRVLATLDDWRAITFVLLFVIVALLFERGWAGWRNYRERQQTIDEREKLWELAQSFGANADKVADALNGVTREIYALRAVSSRIESQVESGK